MTAVALAVVFAVLCWPVRARPTARLPRAPDNGSSTPRRPVAVRRPVVGVAVVAIVGLLLVGGPWWLAGLLAAGAVIGGHARPGAAPGPDELPATADLMAACLGGGASLGDAFSASLVGAGPWLRDRGAPVAAALRAGSPPEEAWRDWLPDPRLAPLARTCIRTTGSGAAAAAELVRLAARLRAAERALRQQRVARAAVWIVLPLGSCFLPAFVAVGVVPLVMSLVAQMH